MKDICLTLIFCLQNSIFHRDINAGNIIVYNGRGYLIDWESAINEDSGDDYCPTGTTVFCVNAVLLALDMHSPIEWSGQYDFEPYFIL